MKARDESSQANDYHYLGRIILGHGQREDGTRPHGSGSQALPEGGRMARSKHPHRHQTQQRPMQTAYSLRELGMVRLEQGDLGQAEQLLGQAETLFRQLRLEDGLVRTQWTQGRLARQRGELREASDCCGWLWVTSTAPARKCGRRGCNSKSPVRSISSSEYPNSSRRPTSMP